MGSVSDLLPDRPRNWLATLRTRAAHELGRRLGALCRCTTLPVREGITRRLISALSDRRIASAFGRRFWLSFVRAVSLGLKRPVLVECSLEPGGLRLVLDVREKSQQGMAIHLRYEGFATRHLQSLLEPGDVAVDVGAHVGYFSLLASRLVGSTGRVVAFEPNPTNRAQLLRNIEINAASNVSVAPFALADYNGTSILYLNPFNEGGGRLVPFERFPDGQLRWSREQASRLFRGQTLEVQVQVRRLHELMHLFAEGRRIAAVKIDVEGGELAALRGMSEILRRDRPALIVEIASASVGAVTGLLKSLGYTSGDRSGMDWVFLHSSHVPSMSR